MGKNDILELFYRGNELLSPMTIVIVLASAVVCGMLIFAVYYFTTDKSVYSRTFNNGNVLMVVITSVIMMMISSNIVISLGMVGALSIIRFRTAVKESRDTIFIFWAMVVGLCVGSQNYTLAALSCLFIAIVVVVLSFVSNTKRRFVMIVRAKDVSTKRIEAAISKGTKRFRMQAVSDADAGSEWVYLLTDNEKHCVAALESVRRESGVASVNLAGHTDEK